MVRSLSVSVLALSLIASSAWANPEASFLLQEKTDLPGVESLPKAGPQKPYESVAILVLSSAEDVTGIRPAELEDSARVAVEKDTALQVVSPEVLAPVSKDVIQACAGEPKCFAKALREKGIDAELVLTISLSSIGENQLLGLLLIDGRPGIDDSKLTIGEVGKELPAGTSPIRAMPDYLGEVFPSSLWGMVATLDVQANAENAEVLLNGLSKCVTPCKVERLYPGAYQLTVKKSGFQPWLGSVDLKPGQVSKVEATMAEEESSLTESPLFWGAVGAGAVAAGVVAFLLLSPDDGPITICIARDEAQCDT